ncbi:MAG: FlgD immunoglobulin-like domain containing protein, partial [Phycisphaerae bacterium]
WAGTTGGHYLVVPGVTVQNSVLAPGSTGVGANYVNSAIVILRNNTFIGGLTGASFTSATTNVTALNNIFSGQTGQGMYFGSDCLTDYISTLASYQGDGNIYAPATGGYVAAINTGASTNNYTLLSDFAKYWYTLQFGANVITPWGDNGNYIGFRSEGRSIQGTPSFTSSATGDFRLAATIGNLMDEGADRVLLRTLASGYPTIWDGIGTARTQGNAIDAGAYETAGPLTRTFTLAAAASTSLGVYDSSNKLVRTLWSGLKFPAGTVTAYWNGLTDSNLVAPNDTYTFKILTNNVGYVWDGAMNNSVPVTGPNVQRNFLPINSMVIVGANAYYCPGYNEQGNLAYRFALSDPHTLTASLGSPDYLRGFTAVDSDGTRVYYLNTGGADATQFAVAFNVSDNSQYTFANGTTYGNWNGLTAGTNGGLIGLAVQRSGNYLYISNKTDNKIYILDKTSGASLGFINVTSPGDLAIDTSNNDLWVISGTSVLRYTGITAGSPGTATLAATISGFTNPLGLAVAQDGTHNILVADGETALVITQQIKKYNNTGTLQRTLG